MQILSTVHLLPHPPPSTLPPRRPGDLVDSQRDRVVKKLAEVEMDSSTVAKQAKALSDSVRKLQKVRTTLVFPPPYSLNCSLHLVHFWPVYKTSN